MVVANMDRKIHWVEGCRRADVPPVLRVGLDVFLGVHSEDRCGLCQRKYDRLQEV